MKNNWTITQVTGHDLADAQNNLGDNQKGLILSGYFSVVTISL